MISFFNDSLTCLNAFFRSRYNLGLEILPACCVASGACRRLESTELLGGFQEAASGEVDTSGASASECATFAFG